MAIDERSAGTRRATPIIVPVGAGTDLPFPTGSATVMLKGEQTGGTLTVIRTTEEPGDGPPAHVHANEDELFLVIEGRISYWADGRWTEVAPGGIVYFPRGSVHCYRNVGTTPSRHWILTTPSGFEHFFASYANELARSGGPDLRRIVAISRDYGITYVEQVPGCE